MSAIILPARSRAPNLPICSGSSGWPAYRSRNARQVVSARCSGTPPDSGVMVRDNLTRPAMHPASCRQYCTNRAATTGSRRPLQYRTLPLHGESPTEQVKNKGNAVRDHRQSRKHKSDHGNSHPYLKSGRSTSRQLCHTVPTAREPGRRPRLLQRVSEHIRCNRSVTFAHLAPVGCLKPQAAHGRPAIPHAAGQPSSRGQPPPKVAPRGGNAFATAAIADAYVICTCI